MQRDEQALIALQTTQAVLCEGHEIEAGLAICLDGAMCRVQSSLPDGALLSGVRAVQTLGRAINEPG
jgi:hypothetical protein